MDNSLQDQALIATDSLRLHSPSTQRWLESRAHVNPASRVYPEYVEGATLFNGPRRHGAGGQGFAEGRTHVTEYLGSVVQYAGWHSSCWGNLRNKREKDWVYCSISFVVAGTVRHISANHILHCPSSKEYCALDERLSIYGKLNIEIFTLTEEARFNGRAMRKRAASCNTHGTRAASSHQRALVFYSPWYF